MELELQLHRNSPASSASSQPSQHSLLIEVNAQWKSMQNAELSNCKELLFLGQKRKRKNNSANCKKNVSFIVIAIVQEFF